MISAAEARGLAPSLKDVNDLRRNVNNLIVWDAERGETQTVICAKRYNPIAVETVCSELETHGYGIEMQEEAYFTINWFENV